MAYPNPAGDGIRIMFIQMPALWSYKYQPESPMKRIAIVQISHEQLLPLLNLPIGTKIETAATDPKSPDLVNVTVTHGHLNEVPDGVAPPIVKPVFATHPALKEFENWGPQVQLEPQIVVVPKPVSVIMNPKPAPSIAPIPAPIP